MSWWNLRELARFTIAGALYLALAIPAAAAPPTGSGTSSDPTSPLDRRLGGPPEFKSLGISKPISIFEGTVLDINDRPVPNVLVQLFDDGELLASATTDGSGIYDLRAVYNLNDDTTSLVPLCTMRSVASVSVNVRFCGWKSFRMDDVSTPTSPVIEPLAVPVPIVTL